MTQYNNVPTMGKFSWKTTSTTGNTSSSVPTHSNGSSNNRTPRKRKEEMTGGGDGGFTTATSNDGVDSGRGPKSGRLLMEAKGPGPVGTEVREVRGGGGGGGTSNSQEVAEEGEIVEDANAGNGDGATTVNNSPVRRSTRIHTRSEEDLTSTDEGNSQGPVASDKSFVHPPTLPTTSSPIPGEAKRVRIHTNSMHQCSVCGKMYKHRNCLTKHAWEHHESWALTKKWCQTKHQQVQMLEAAQVLTELTLLGGGEPVSSSTTGSGTGSGKTSRRGTISSF